MLIGCQMEKEEEREGGNGGGGVGEIHSFLLDGSIFCHGFRMRCKTGH